MFALWTVINLLQNKINYFIQKSPFQRTIGLMLINLLCVLGVIQSLKVGHTASGNILLE